MSDPASGEEVYTCCYGPMRLVRLPKIHPEPLFFCCYNCGVVRHRHRIGDPLRDTAEVFMDTYAKLVVDSKRGILSGHLHGTSR